MCHHAQLLTQLSASRRVVTVLGARIQSRQDVDLVDRELVK